MDIKASNQITLITGATGATGNGIKSITDYYQVSTSNTTAPTSWVTTAPTMTTTNKYLWNYEEITYTDGSTESTSKRVIGVYGDTGAAGKDGTNGKDGKNGTNGSDGVGVSSIVNYYLASTASSGVAANASGWTDTVQTISSTKKYLWNFERITYTNGIIIDTTPCVIGVYGDTGATGSDGKDGTNGKDGSDGVGIASIAEYYQVSTSNTTAPTSWVTTPPTLTTTNKYLWNYEVIIYTDGTTENTAKRVIGVYGDTGTKGDTGADGKSIGSITNYYLATSSSSGVTTGASGWTTTVQSVSASKKYLWNYEVIKYTDGTVAATSAPCIIGAYGDTGATGATGADGNGISSITEYYQVSTSNTTAPTSWSTTVPTMTAVNKYLWNYELITYTNGSSESTSKRVIGAYGEKGDNGAAGADGRGIKSTEIAYQASASGTTAPTGTWTTNIPSTSAALPYLWSRTIITYTDNTTSTTYSVGSTPEGIVVGGRNLVIGSSKYRANSPAVTGDTDDAYTYLATSVALEEGKTYTLQAVSDSVWSTSHGVANGEGKATIWIASTDKTYHRVFTGDGVTSGRYTWTFTHASDTGEYVVRVNGYAKATSFWDIKIESGNKATDWTPAPEDTEVEITNLTTRVTDAETQIESNKNEISLRATTDFVETTITNTVGGYVDKTTFEQYKVENKSELSVMADQVEISVSESIRQEIKDGDDNLLALYEEMRMNYDFTADGQYIGGSESDTVLHLSNDTMEILVANTAVTTVDVTGLSADQANIKTLHIGDYTLALGEDDHLTLT